VDVVVSLAPDLVRGELPRMKAVVGWLSGDHSNDSKDTTKKSERLGKDRLLDYWAINSFQLIFNRILLYSLPKSKYLLFVQHFLRKVLYSKHVLALLPFYCIHLL
jgi:hypothetical protein